MKWYLVFFLLTQGQWHETVVSPVDCPKCAATPVFDIEADCVRRLAKDFPMQQWRGPEGTIQPYGNGFTLQAKGMVDGISAIRVVCVSQGDM